ncbi:major facilitator superfamily domain-containing protein [Cercophora newfieldiana]|uniref:Major facilitator superfamily domain-containing protein n=1 Tax=Cercophora newfieldiana TaxID=92897 RepID=A0AA39YKD2_9PEZI|nr:major facilitator superfamily domain-containing protein [Cercophora newfieldiana]
MFTLGSVLLTLFGINEWKFARLPMFPFRLFKNPALAAMLIQNFLIGIVFYSLVYILPVAAALIVPIVMPQAIASALSGQYISRMGRYGEVIWTGYILWVIGTGLHIAFSRMFPLAAIIVILVVEGFGVGLVFQPTLVAAQAHSPKQDRAVVISARNFIRSLGGAAGLAIASATFSNTIVNQMPKGIPDQLAHRIREAVFEVPDLAGLTGGEKDLVLDLYARAAKSVFYLWFGAMAVCLGLMVFIKDRGLRRNEEAGQKESGASSVVDSGESRNAVKVEGATEAAGKAEKS